jgi:hypothetical protein
MAATISSERMPCRPYAPERPTAHVHGRPSSYASSARASAARWAPEQRQAATLLVEELRRLVAPLGPRTIARRDRDLLPETHTVVSVMSTSTGEDVVDSQLDSRTTLSIPLALAFLRAHLGG